MRAGRQLEELAQIKLPKSKGDFRKGRVTTFLINKTHA